MCNMVEQNGFMSVSECARAIGVHENTIRKYIKNGKLKAFKVGRQLYKIKQEDFDSFFKSLEVKPFEENTKTQL